MQRLEILLHYGVEGNFVTKSDVEEYIQRVKRNNPRGVVLCIDTEEGTQEKVKTDGAFNVYLNIGEKVFIDFLGKGFDMGAITKGKEVHESWTFDWDDALFITPRNMNKYRNFIISDEDYLASGRSRLAHLINLGYNPEDIKGHIPRRYTPMDVTIKKMLLDEILFPLYCEQDKLKASGLYSLGVQGMVLQGRLFPIEINRNSRFASKEDLDCAKEIEI